jgi:hypothetical protein
MAFGHERYSHAEVVTPVRQRSLMQMPSQFMLDRPVQQIGIASHQLEPDEQRAEKQAHDQQRNQKRACHNRPERNHEEKPKQAAGGESVALDCHSVIPRHFGGLQEMIPAGSSHGLSGVVEHPTGSRLTSSIHISPTLVSEMIRKSRATVVASHSTRTIRSTFVQRPTVSRTCSKPP